MHTAHGIDSRHDVAALGDEQLLASLRRLLAEERTLSARLLVHLGEVDARGLYREHAYASMFDYCVQALHLSEAEAYLRIRAARLARRFPRVLPMMASGELHLSAAKLLSPVLTEANADDLLAQARYKSKRDVELLLARHFEKPDVSTSIRALPDKRPAQRLVPEPVAEQAQPLFATTASLPISSTPPAIDIAEPVPSSPPQPSPAQPRPALPPPPALTPLGPKRYKLQLTADQALHDKLRQAQHLMRRDVPDGDVGHILERALDLLIADRMKRRFATTEKPRIRREQSAPKPDSRHIPHDVRRQVLARDGARGSYLHADGKRCDQRAFLELHHEQPFGRGGPATVANIRVLCSAHNKLRAERDYGEAFMRQRIERAKRERGGSPERKPIS